MGLSVLQLSSIHFWSNSTSLMTASQPVCSNLHNYRKIIVNGCTGTLMENNLKVSFYNVPCNAETCVLDSSAKTGSSWDIRKRERKKKRTQEILLLSLPDGQSSHGNKIVELCKLMLNRIVCISSSVSLNVGFEAINTGARGIRMQQPVIQHANDSFIVIVQS